MYMHDDVKPPAAVQRAARVVTIFVGLSGVAILAGWQIDVELQRLSPGFVSMNPAIAVTFVFASIGLLLQLPLPPNSSSPLHVQRLIGSRLCVDRILFREQLTSVWEPVPGRMDTTAMSFYLTGLSPLFLELLSKQHTKPLEANVRLYRNIQPSLSP